MTRGKHIHSLAGRQQSGSGSTRQAGDPSEGKLKDAAVGLPQRISSVYQIVLRMIMETSQSSVPYHAGVSH